MALCAYSVAQSRPSAETHALIATQTGHWMVYRGTQLLWTAKAETVPIALAVLKVDGLEGVILALDERGHLSLNYLGTEPNTELPLFSTVGYRI